MMKGEARCIVTFFTVHQALRAEKVLMEAGFKITMIPVPREISSDCGVALAFECEEETRVKEVLDSNTVKTECIHHLEGK
jgi:N-acyl-L-homoserine lactone synthetase